MRGIRGARAPSVVLPLCGLLLLASFTGSSGTGDCPRSCFCNVISHIVYCSRRGLPYIPDDVPRDSLQLNLNGNVFRTATLERANFSRLPLLEHLYLSECGIEKIEVDTFLDLSNLQWLDLSNNRIKVVQDFNFRGLSLMHLFLNGNRNIQLRPKSFAGLDTTGLYLQDCSLKRVPVEVIAPLNITLRYLWLNGNEMERLSRKLLPMFQTLSHLRLFSNPLHCNCEMLWMKEFYDKNLKIFDGADPPSCFTPAWVKGEKWNGLSSTHFRCQPPTFNNIDAVFDNDQGKLKCTATGDPAPTLFWIQPTGQSRKYSPPDVEEEEALGRPNAMQNVGILNIENHQGHNRHHKKDLSGMYICVANNEAGNVTLTLNVSWPPSGPTRVTGAAVTRPPLPPDASITTPSSTVKIPQPSHYPGSPIDNKKDKNMRDSKRPSSSTPNPSAGDNPQQKRPPLSRDHYNFTSALNMLDFKRNGERLFNLTELVGAIIGTHVCTLLLCLIFMPIYLKKQWKRRRHPTNSMEKTPPHHESLFLNGLGRHPNVDFMDSPSPIPAKPR